MLPGRSLLSCLLLAFGGVLASPVSRDTGKATLKFSRGFSTTGSSNLAQKDRARVQAFVQRPHLSQRSASTGSGSVSVANAAVYYTAEVGVGTPPTNYTLLIDTGSATTWVGASQQYIATSSSVNTGGYVYGVYGAGTFFGEQWRDTVTLAPDLVIEGQSIGVANWTSDISGVDGFLGLGPVNLTTGTSSTALEVPTVMDNLYSQGTISQEVLGVFFSPVSESDCNGTLTFGGYDNSVITGPVNYVPLTTTFPASEFWGIDQSISYGNNTILSLTSGIVDTGTTLILIATDAFEQYQSLTGATLDSTTGLLTITSSQYDNLQTLSFNIGGTSYDLTPNAQIWPRSLNTFMGGSSSSIYLIVNDIGFSEGLLFNFVNGYCFLERYYSIYDTNLQRLGIAQTIYTYSDTN